jgi:hypothetical protein
MANPTLIPKKSVLAGAVPTTEHLALGEICVNHADRRLYSRNPSTGEIYKLAGAKDAPDRVFVFDSAGDTTYLGYLLYTAVPATGSIYDAAQWEISRTTFNSTGTSATEASATGAWNDRATLTYA